MKARLLITLIAFLLCLTVAQGQRQSDRPALIQLSDAFRQDLQNRRPQLYYDLLASDDPATQALNRNPNIQLMYIDDLGMPVYYKAHNLNAARTISTDKVWPGGGSGHDLTGKEAVAGRLAVWDVGGVFLDHQEFGGRVRQMDDPESLHRHATAVAATMMAAGVDPAAKGMSYESHIDAYDWMYDEAEMAAAAANGLAVSNQSYGSCAGWEFNRENEKWYWHGNLRISTREDYWFGFYSPSARARDLISFYAPYYLIVKSAGNDRDDVGPQEDKGHYHWDGRWVWSTDTHNPDGAPDGYDILDPPVTAKNTLSVGAVADIPTGYREPSDVVQTTFSSWGPTDDGRIKPDLVANGDSLFTASIAGVAEYDIASGTSYSSPNVSGSLNLLRLLYERLNGTLPRSATLKAIAIFSADEAGEYDGPDYSNGWGLMNTARGADAIAGAVGIVEAELANGDVRLYEFTVDIENAVRATVVWTDPPGPVLEPALDPGTRVLVNDLDVRVEQISTGDRYEPWVLSRQEPSAPAERGDNKVDNVEQIDIANAQPGNYLIALSHKGSLSSGRQAFSVVCSESISVYLVSSYRSCCFGKEVDVTWTMADSAGDYSYIIERKTMPSDMFQEIRRRVTESGAQRTLRDKYVQFEHTYVYRISILRNQTIAAQFTTAVTTPPYVFTLEQNYPNPFNPTTSIDYILERSGPMSLKIYDVTGGLVRTLVDRSVEKGQYSEIWDGTDSRGNRVANGVYFYRLVSGGQSAARKMVLLR